MALSTSASSILTSSISTSRSLYCPSSNSGSTSKVARNFTGPLSAKSTLSTCGCVTGTILFSLTARSICSGHQRLQHFALDVVGKLAADQRYRRLPGTKSRHARHARKFPRHTFHRLLYRLPREFPAPARAGKSLHSSLGLRIAVYVMLVGIILEPPEYSHFYSLPLLGPEKGNGKELRAGYNEAKV